jgi:ribonuclease Y
MNKFSLLILLLEAVVVVICFWIGYLFRRYKGQKDINSAEIRVEQIILDAQKDAQQITTNAQKDATSLVEHSKTEIAGSQQETKLQKQKLESREDSFNKQVMEFQIKQEKLYTKLNNLEEETKNVQKLKERRLRELERISGLNSGDAKELVIKSAEDQYQLDILHRIKKIEQSAASDMERRAYDTLATIIQRCAMSNAGELSSTTVSIPSDDIKGKIIGKEGRNIKTIEQLIGVEIVVDDTPGSIMISGFSPVRRHLAKRALEKLIVDGRIHPARIEEIVEETRLQMSQEITKAGEDALFELGITGIDPKLVQVLGRLKFRTSYSQNVLQHSLEVAHLSKLLAEELKIDSYAAAKGGLFHDIGKSVDHDVPGAHTHLGHDIMIKYGFPEEIAYMAIAHHEDSPTTVLGVIVKTADSISGGRPGARKDTYDNYVKRLTNLENVTAGFAGVLKTYAIQAGREIRIFINPEQINDLEAYKLAQDVARKIESSLRYPGEIKVTVIRETKIIEYAR